MTLDCIPDANNNLVVQSCRVWEQNANHATSCTNLATAGTGSKCDCEPLTVTDIPVPSAGTIEVIKSLPVDGGDLFDLWIDAPAEPKLTTWETVAAPAL